MYCLLDIIRGGKQMKEIVIPKTELKVSALCLGGGLMAGRSGRIRKGLDYWLLVETLLTPPILRTVEAGGGVSVSERFLGKYIKSRKCRNRIHFWTRRAQRLTLIRCMFRGFREKTFFTILTTALKTFR